MTLENLPIRPYARLLTMLGEQLIKNDRIALVELVKNSYDADATEVQIAFEDFGPRFEATPMSKVILSDNGDGMSLDVVREHWLNPATNLKVERKQAGLARTTRGRFIQGEKGIGRFAMFKLGAKVSMSTKTIASALLIRAEVDIAFLDQSERPGESRPLFLDEMSAKVWTETFQPGSGAIFPGDSDHGTRLEIIGLRSNWSNQAVLQLHQDLARLTPLSSLLTGRAGTDNLDFQISYLINGQAPDFLHDSAELLSNLGDRAVLRVVGTFSAETGVFNLTVNERDREVNINSEKIRGLRLFREAFGKSPDDIHLECGSYTFEFMIFDLRNRGVDVRHKLDPDEARLVRDHRVYLYRDSVRVLPYGDPEDDWLQLDVIRGTQAASRVFSNDQTIGFVYITQEENPDLRDKTNREGLIDAGRAYADFVLSLQLLITYLRREDFAHYLAVARERDEAEKRRRLAGLDGKFEQLITLTKGTPRVASLANELAASYQVEHEFMVERIQRTEDLAGVGLSVETASHDVVAAANESLRSLRMLQNDIGSELGIANPLYQRLISTVDSISFIVSRLQDVQGLFVSSGRRRGQLDPLQYARKVENIYARLLRDRGIEVSYSVSHSKLRITSSEAALLQVLLNLMDNSVYWLDAARTPEPRILITIEESRKTLMFSDNGPGVSTDDEPYIFDVFFSGKGDAGRGLGLYIAREVARRNGFELTLNSAGPLPGANFVLDFGREDD